MLLCTFMVLEVASHHIFTLLCLVHFFLLHKVHAVTQTCCHLNSRELNWNEKHEFTPPCSLHHPHNVQIQVLTLVSHGLTVKDKLKWVPVCFSMLHGEEQRTNSGVVMSIPIWSSSFRERYRYLEQESCQLPQVYQLLPLSQHPEVTTSKLPLKKPLLRKSVQPSQPSAIGLEKLFTPSFLCCLQQNVSC